MGNGHPLGRVLRIHHILRLGLLQREIDHAPNCVVRFDHGVGQHSDVRLRAPTVVQAEGR